MRRAAVPIVAGLILVALLAALRVANPQLLRDARLAVFDVYQRLSPRPYQSAPVRVVDIDDATLERLGQWPWPRTLVADLVDRLGRMGAASIAFDIVFAEPDRLSPSRLLPSWTRFPELAEFAAHSGPLPDFDELLAATIARYRVVGGFALIHRDNSTTPAAKATFAQIGGDPLPFLPHYTGAIVNLPVLEQAFTGNGSFSMDRDLVVRRLPLLQAKDGHLFPTLSTEALRVAQGAPTLAVRTATSESQTLGVERLRIGRIDIPVAADAGFWLHYTEAVPQRSVPAWRVLAQNSADGELTRLFKGHIVLIGTSAIGLGDFAPTPMNPVEPGVLIHAQAIEQMVQGWFLERPYWADGVELLLLIGLGLALLVLMPLIGAAWCALLGIVVTGAALAGSWLAFTQYRLLFDPVFPSLATLLIYLLLSLIVYLRSERERAWIRHAFAQYLAPDLVHQLVENPGRLNLGGELREMTFLFSDIAGFTSLTEASSPQELVRLLNAYLDGACKVVMDHGGAIDKIVGDAIHALFNAPMEQSDHALRAVRCALALDEFAQRFVAEQKLRGVAFGITRIGVNTGPAVVGNFGGERRFDYTAHGDAINTAARLESANKQLGTKICVSGTTVEYCPDMVFRPLGTLLLRGKTIGVEAFEPLANDADIIPWLNDYLGAFELLKSGDPAAHEAFSALAKTHPNDPVVALHLRRFAEGATDNTLKVD